MWLLGNEPDCIWQGNIVPEEYAHIYHEFYTFIKGRDPTSMVAPGGIVQATPLRFQWLNRVLETYQQSYGTKMPVDVWNIHNAIVNEKKGGWGAEIPPGIDAEEGRILPNDFHDNDNMDIFRQQIRAFRQWMKDNGYGGYSLIISEFGVLMPEILGFDAARVNAFMSATFDYLQNATDPNLGDPNDGYRLVQRWAWFSLDFPAYDPAIGYGFNGNLFDPQSATLTPMGYHYAQHTSGLPAVTHVDLALEGVVPSLLFKPILPGETVTRTVYVKVANHGNLNSGSFNVRLQSDGPVDYVLEETVANLAPGAETLLSFVLPDLPLGNYWLNARVDTEESVVESAECNNQAARAMMVPSHLLILPLVSH
jgi:hypothetical protein